jgi:hypothetical protein
MAQEYSKRVWEGDPTTVAEAKAKHESDPAGQLIPLAVALYSFRTNQHFANELLALRPQIIAYAVEYTKKPLNDDSPKARANKSDVLSTYLEWMSRRSELSEEDQADTAYEARCVCQHGILTAQEVLEQTDHTLCLLLLTLAHLDIHEKHFTPARKYLDEVATSARHIADANQKARVYRKLGYLYRKCHQSLLGIKWGIRGCFVPETPPAVRIKSVAALFGLDA